MMRTARRALSALALLLAAGGTAAAPQVIVPVRDVDEPPALRAGAKAVRFNRELLLRAAPGEPVELTLPDGRRHAFVFERTIAHGGDTVTWIARGDATGDSDRAVLTISPAGTWGWMKTSDGEWRIYPGGSNDWLLKRAPMNYAPQGGGSDAVAPPPDTRDVEHLKGVSTSSTPSMEKLAKSAPADNKRVDLMIIYTKDLAEKLGAGLMPMLYNLVASTNQAYIDSEISLTLRLVNATMLDYPNANGSTATLNGMAGSGAFASIFQGLTWQAGTSTRDAFGADVVALVRDGPTDTGGIGFLLKNPTLYPTVSATSTAAYSVSNFCAQGCEGIVAHEIGHNMGNSHDRATVGYDGGGIVPAGTDGVFSYSYGHYDCSNGLTCNPFAPGGCPSGRPSCASAVANDFGTIMSYFGPKVMKFSNPSVLCNPAGGTAPGRPCGVAGQNDNALSMNNIRQNLAAYRNQTITNLAGSLQFTATGYSAAESSGLVTFTVSRTNGSSGAVSATYNVTSGTALAGIDFTAQSGTLNWADGDAADKTFSVTLANDQAPEGIEAFTATLSAPTGATGVYLGYPTTATGVIIEPWPPAGTMPAGWTNAVGSSSPWAVATDSSFDGDGSSLKSGPIDFAVANRLCGTAGVGYGLIPCPSAIQYSATFATGTISYAYRVSSFPNNGFLEFLVDGVVVQSVSGTQATADTGWQTFSTPITAGAHTLVWQYRPVFYFACAFASSGGPPPYPSCADRAWIDSVSLPLPLAASTTALGTSANPANVGQSLTFTATVSGGVGAPTGTVAFRDATSVISGCNARPIAAGTATCVTTALATGSHQVTAAYSGSPVYAASVSTPLTETVNGQADLAITQTSSNGSGGIGYDMVFTMTATNNGPAAATNVVVSTAYEPSATVVWVSPGCVKLGASAVYNCPVALLANGASVQFRLVLRPTSLANLFSNAQVLSNTADSISANNTAPLSRSVFLTLAGSPVLRYRLYSPVTLEHHFTTDLNEYNVLGTYVGTWVQEGTVGKVLNNPGTFGGVTAVPYYRLYNTGNRWHHWTTDANEYYTLITYPGWNGEGVDGYILPTAATGAIQLYRLNYPGVPGLHHWTIDANEYTTLITPAYGWIGEGGAGFVIP